MIVESGPAADPVKHIRLRRDTVHLWCLDVADHAEIDAALSDPVAGERG